MPQMTHGQFLAWADALDSGQFTQIRNRLTNETRPGNYDWSRSCCLGVCTRVIQGPDTWEYPSNWLLLTSSQESMFTNMNDVWRFSFNEIAAFIRAHIDMLVAGNSVDYPERVQDANAQA